MSYKDGLLEGYLKALKVVEEYLDSQGMSALSNQVTLHLNSQRPPRSSGVAFGPAQLLAVATFVAGWVLGVWFF